MPPPATFYTITDFPHTQVVDDADFNAGTHGTAANEVWFKHVPTEDGMLGVYVSGLHAAIYLYETDALTLIREASGANERKTLRGPMTAGRSYWVLIQEGGGGPASADFTVGLDRATVHPTIQRGQIIVNDPGADRAAVVLQLDGTVVGFLTNAPGGEVGHALPSGVSLWQDRYELAGVVNRFSVFDAQFNRIASFNLSPDPGSAFARITNDGTVFYVAVSGGAVHTVTADGLASGIIANLGETPNAIAVNPDGTILFYGSGDTIKRWDLMGDSALPDLYSTGGADVAVLSGGVGGDILYLADGTIATFATVSGTEPDTLLHVDQHGTLLHSYSYDEPASIHHITYAADNPAAISLWLHLNTAQSRGRFQHVVLATGVADTTFDVEQFFEDLSLGIDGTTVFGPAASCPLVLIGYNSSAEPCCNAGNTGPTQGPTSAPTLTPNQPPPTTAPPPCCGTAGPGGVPPSTGFGPGPTPTTPNTPPTPPIPIIIPEGGEEPAYNPCSSDGVPASAADPVNAQDLTTCTTPLVHMKWTLPDASVRRYGKNAFTSGNGQAVSARVLKWGSVAQTLSDKYGSFQASSFTVTLSDYDHAIRTILSASGTKYIDGKEVEILIETKANAALSVTPLVIARGIVTNWKYNADLTFSLTVTDPLGYRFSAVSLDRPLPNRVVRLELFPLAPEQNQKRALPIIYGDMGDDYTWSLNPDRIPVGICYVIHVGRANSINGVGVPGSTWEAFVVAGHAISGIQSVFASNLDPAGEASVRMSEGTYGADFLVPGVNVDLYYDIVASDGVTERVCLFFARGPRADAHIKGRVPITVNVCGIEDVGDGSGDMITDEEYQFQHFLSYWVVQNYLTGTWGAVPAFSDGTAKVRTSSFSTCRTTHGARLGTAAGYIGAIHVGTQKPAREWNREFQESGDMRLGVNNHGQLLAVSVDDHASTSGLTTFTAQSNVIGDSFEIDPNGDEIFNIYTYEYGPEPATNRVSGVARTIRHSASITHHGERIAQARVYGATRHKPTADDVANRTMLRSADAPTTVSFALNLEGTAIAIGQLIRVTSYLGIGVTGWTNRVLLVTGIRTNLDEDAFSTIIDCDDVGDFVTGTQFVIGTSLIGTGTIG